MPKLRGKGYWKALELTDEGRLFLKRKGFIISEHGMRKGSLVRRYLGSTIG